MEREEPQLYLSMKIITKKQFQAHVGFDLANWEDRDATEGSVPLEFRFKKAAKMGELMEYIAKQKGCSADQLRPWTMSTRQNMTIRPDQPLSDLDRSRLILYSAYTHANSFSCRGNGHEA
jgi:ubiquitin carboxyl-terminal hydrolase 7